MKNYRNLNINGIILDKLQLENYMEKLASGQVLQDKSDKNTYPIPRMKENFKIIEKVYNLLRRTYKIRYSHSSCWRMASR